MAARQFAPLIGLVVILAACGGSDEPETIPDTTPPNTATMTAEPDGSGDQAPTTAADGAEGSGCTPSEQDTLPDGRWFGLVSSTTDDSVEFDLACWFTGDAAVAAAEAAGEESPPPNDYFVRNNNDLTRDLPVSPDAEVTFYLSGDPQSDVLGDYPTWLTTLEDRGTLFGIWIETTSGEITTIREQWVP